MGNDDARANPDLVRILVDLWMHQNQLMWGRVQLLIALQGAVFAANYALAHRLTAFVVFTAAIAATLGLGYIWDVDRIMRNKYSDILRNKYDFHVGYTPNSHDNILVEIIPGLRLPAIANSKASLQIIFGFLILCDLIALTASLGIFNK